MGSNFDNRFVCTNNSSEDILSASGVFTGTKSKVDRYSIASIFLYSDQDSAVDGISIEQSIDGVNWDLVRKYTYIANTTFMRQIILIGTFYRVVFTNGSTDQTEFRLKTTYYVNTPRITEILKNQIIEANHGNIPGVSMDHQGGWSDQYDTTIRHLWNHPTGVNLIWQTSAAKYDISSSNANDTLAGTGARTVRITGIIIVSGLWIEASEIVNMSGATPVTTVNDYIRLNHAEVVDVGTYTGSNIGLITIQITGGGNPQGYIEAGVGKSQKSHITIASNETAFVHRVSSSVDSNKTMDLALIKRENADSVAAPFGAKKYLHQWNGITVINEDFNSNHRVIGPADIWFEGAMTSTTGTVQSDIDLMVIDNNQIDLAA